MVKMLVDRTIWSCIMIFQFNISLLLAILAGLFAYSAQPITRGLISQIVNADEQGKLNIQFMVTWGDFIFSIVWP